MSSRAGQWELVGYDSDPVPASEWDVDGVADEMRRRADAAAQMHGTLKQLAALEGWTGKTAEEFASRAGEVVSDLGKVEERYSRVVTALDRWRDDVNTARSRTWQQLQQAEAASAEMRAHPASEGVGPMTPEEKVADARHQEARQDLEAARSRLHDAMEQLDSAAQTAKNEIDEAAGVWDDGWWGDIAGWVREHAEAIAIVCKVLEVVATVLAVAVAVAAIVASAPFALVAAAFVAGALLLGGHLLLVTSETGKATWGDVAWDLFNLATLGVGGGLTKWVGKGVSKLIPAVARGVGSGAKTSALARLSRGNLVQVRNALRITDPENNLYRWAARISRASAREGEEAAAPVRSLRGLDPKLGKTLAVQDRGLARMHGQLTALKPYVDELADPNLQHQYQVVRRRLFAAMGINVGGNTVTAVKGVPDLPGQVQDIVAYSRTHSWTSQPTR